MGVAVTVERVDRGEPFRDSGNASLVVGKQVTSIVRQATEAKLFPLVLGGSCDVSKFILSGFAHRQCGVVWCDAHGDFNTPETTTSGYFDGMSLAVITGHCYRSYWRQIGNSTPIFEAATLMLGVRDLDPAEKECLERSAVQVVKWHEGKPQEDVRVALDKLAQRVHRKFISISIWTA